MSGGSFNYASVREIELSGPSDDHKAIVGALAEYPGADIVVARARAALAKWEQVVTIMAEVDAEWSALRSVLRAVEWHHSSDVGEDDVVKAIAEFK